MPKAKVESKAKPAARKPIKKAAPVIQEIAHIEAMLERAIFDPKFTAEKLQLLTTMRDTAAVRERKRAFAAAFVAMKPHLPTVARKETNTQTDSSYARLDDINAEVDPILEQFGFATMTKVASQGPETVEVVAELWHESGHVELTSVIMPVEQGEMSLRHAVAAAITFAKRYAVCAILNISTGNDTDGNHPDKALTPQQVGILNGKLAGAPDAARKWFNKEYPNGPTQKDFEVVLAKLNKQIKTFQAKAAK